MIDTPIVVGVATNHCVETAMREASDRSFNMILVGNGCTAMSEEHHRFALEILIGVY